MADFIGILIRLQQIAEQDAGATLTVPAWVVSTSIPTPALAVDQVITAPAWTVSTTVFTPAQNIPLTVPPWDVSTTVGVSGQIVVDGNLAAPPWSVSTNVIGPVLSGPILAPAWDVSTTIFTPAAVGPIVAPAWNVSTTINTPVAAGPIIAPAWVTTTFVRTPTASALLSVPAWVVSTTVPTPQFLPAQILTAPAWTVSTTVPTPSTAPGLRVPFIGPLATFPTPVIAGPLIAPFIDASPTFFTPTITRTVDFSINVTDGLTTGNEPIILLGSALDMSSCTPDFTDGTIDPGFWTDISTNSGEVLEVVATQSLRLNTGVTPNSVAGVRTVELAADLDIEVAAVSLVADPTVTAAFELALYVSSTTDFRLIVGANGSITMQVQENGNFTFNQQIATTGGSPQFRLLRVDSTVFVFLGGTLVTTAAWVATDCNIELLAENNPTATSQAATRVSQYLRRPVVVFDTTPLTDIEVISPDQALATTPARNLPGAIDVRLTGCTTTTDTIADAFTYELDPVFPKVLNIPNQATLTAISDPIVSGQISRSV